jgi:ligand-binding sensor domain-containing protein/serine phosphatase RsbU (regulator of sigma subunit)
VGTNDKGLYRLTSGDSLKVENYSIEEGLLNYLVNDIYEDDRKRIWLAMPRGVNIIEFSAGTGSEIKHISTPNFNMNTDSLFVYAICPGQNGTVWLGTNYYGKGLFRAIPASDNKGFTIESSRINKMIPGLIIWDIHYRKNGELWVATENNGVLKLRDDKITGYFTRENGLISNQITCIMEDREGNSWFASFGQGIMMYDDEKFISYDTRDGLAGNQVRDILFDADNTFYAATEAGLQRFKKEGNSIKLMNSYNQRSGLNDAGVVAISRTSEKQLWIGTNKGINILQGNKLSEFRWNDRLESSRISSILADRFKNIWIGTGGGIGKVSDDNLFFINQNDSLINNEVSTVFEDSKGNIWVGTYGGLVRFDYRSLTSSESLTLTSFDDHDGLSTLNVSSLAGDPAGNILIGTSGGGIFRFDDSKDSLPISILARKDTLSSNNINSLRFICDSLLIAGNDKGFDLLILDKKFNVKRVIPYSMNDGFSGVESNPNAISADNDGCIWFGTKNGLVRYDPGVDFKNNYRPAAYITGLRLFDKEIGLPGNLALSHKDNRLTFEFTGICFHNPDDLEFSYSIGSNNNIWSSYSRNREVVLGGLTPGDYTFKIKARNKLGMEGNTSAFHFVITPPFWKTPWFYFTVSILFLSAVIAIIRLRERKLVLEKIQLEKIIEERTHEIVEKKNEIERQRDVVINQKNEITDSIHYAERIQKAVLPGQDILKKYFSDYFIILRPKDIVSGDFYWMAEKNDHLVVTAADCTGHGVPGALMSMLGISFLEKIVNEEGIVKPSMILTSMRENIISALKQEESDQSTKDGMDMALCSLDIINKKLFYSGAVNPLYLIRGNGNEYVLTELRGDRMPIGYYSEMAEFTNHEVDIQKGDTLYLYSDGFVDQFGGPKGKKFMVPRFKQMLLDHQASDMVTQREAFVRILDEWISCPSESRRNNEQIDDIILLGLRI